jgi:required for meiotic nuclear division protein 1
LQLVGSALLTQHRVSGRIAFAEKPDILWEHPELERYYARLEDEYEIVERGTLLNGKMTVITTAAQTFTDMMDTARSARLELLIVILILAEIAIAAVALFRP